MNNPNSIEHHAKIKVTFEIDWILPNRSPTLSDEEIRRMALLLVQGHILNYDWRIESKEVEIIEIIQV